MRLRHGDQIYGLVAAAGLSNDCRGDLLAPSSEGQLRAMRQAYEKAGWRPGDVDLIECHATGAAVGDAVEVESLKSLWGDGPWRAGQCPIGSVKSNIGHALTAAGAAGLLKVLLAIKHRILPPTANFEIPAPKLGLEASPFRVLRRAEPWRERRAGQPRRAAVSGFGFGGINAHVLIEEWMGSQERPRAAHPRAKGGSAPIAIVGMAARFGSIDGLPQFRQHILSGDRDAAAGPPSGWWGIPDAPWFRAHAASKRRLDGLFIDELEFPVDQFRIPPRELGEMLPQQSLVLKVATDAARDARWDERLALATCVVIGIGLDPSTTNYHLRWSLAAQARQWNARLALGLSQGELESWIDDLKSAAGPALSANRTIGSLGGMVASRIARELRIGGPSFTVSCDETSGMQALAIASSWLSRGELGAAIVGAVDLGGDLRAVLARLELTARSGWMNANTASPCDGAVALVLKRLDDARRDGDRVYALLNSADGGWDECDLDRDRGPIEYVDLQSAGGLAPGEERGFRAAIKRSTSAGQEDSFALGSIEGDLGAAGAASGLAAVAKAALCLRDQIIPGLRDCPDWLGCSGAIKSSVFLPEGSQFWVRNRAEGARRAAVVASNLGGSCQRVVLEEFGGDTADISAVRHFDSPSRRPGLFAIQADDRSALFSQIKRLAALASGQWPRGIDELARAWWRANRDDSQVARGMAVIADSVESLRRLLDDALERVRGGGQSHPRPHGVGEANRIYLKQAIPSGPKRLAFVYPGLGNQFPGMGRGLSLLWPEALRALDAENKFLRDQLDPRVWWADDAPHAFEDHLVPILGSVSLGCFVTDVLRSLGLTPQAAIGYSLGETTALLALGGVEPARRDAASAQVVAVVSDRAGRPVQCSPARLADTRERAGELGRRHRAAVD